MEERAVQPDDFSNKKQIIEKYLPYVKSIASKIKRTLAKEIEFDDLFEYGMIGLLEAAERYDPVLGANFMTFAYYRIRGAIYDGLRGMGWISRTEYAKYRFEEKANNYLQSVHNREVSAGVNSETGSNSNEEEITQLADVVNNLATIFVTSIEGAEEEGLQIQDEAATNRFNEVEEGQNKQIVRECIAKLPEQEKQLLELYYYDELSLQEVGERLGLSKSWTSRLHARALDKLQRLLRERLHYDPKDDESQDL